MQNPYLIIPITEKRRRKDVERIISSAVYKQPFYADYSLFIHLLCIIRSIQFAMHSCGSRKFYVLLQTKGQNQRLWQKTKQ